MRFDIENGILKNAWGDDEIVTVPDNVTVLESGVFSSFAYMTDITLPDGLKEIKDHVFNNCMEITHLELPGTVSVIGEYAFQYCKRMKSFRMSPLIKSIESCTFRYCQALKELTLPASVESVDYDAFFGCDELVSFTAENPGCTFGRRAFYGCNKLSRLDAPLSALQRLSEEQLANVCIGFCHEPETYTNAAEEAYKEVLKSPNEAFMTRVCENDDDRALHFLLSQKLLGAEETDIFLGWSRKLRANKCSGALLQYKNSLGGDGIEDMMRELEL